MNLHSIFENMTGVEKFFIFVIMVWILTIIIVKIFYRKGRCDKAIIVTRNTKRSDPKLCVAGGTWINPFTDRVYYLNLFTLIKDGKGKYLTSIAVEISVKWTAVIKVDVSNLNNAINAMKTQVYKDDNEFEDIINKVFSGALCDNIALHTPEEVLSGRESLNQKIEEDVSKVIANMGWAIITFNIQEVSDDVGYYSEKSKFFEIPHK